MVRLGDGRSVGIDDPRRGRHGRLRVDVARDADGLVADLRPDRRALQLGRVCKQEAEFIGQQTVQTALLQ